MRLAWIVPDRLGQLTGGYLYDARMIDGLRASGHEVAVVELGQRLSWVDPLATAHLVGALAGRRWDLLIFDELAHPAMALGQPALRIAGVVPASRTLALVHHLRASEPASRLARRLATFVERAALVSIDLVVCTSTSTAGVVRHLVGPNQAVEVVPPGCDFHIASATPAAPNACDAATGAARLLMVAHWTPRKGVLEALRALALTSPSISLDLVGDPSRDPAYARRIRHELARPELVGRVRVHGTVSSARLARLYRQADALLVASSHEGYGIVLIEALAAGLPIVATRVGAIPEVVRDGLEAELVPFGQVEALARALARLADPAERRRRARYARERLDSLPTWRESCARFTAVAERLVATARPQPVAARGVRIGD